MGRGRDTKGKFVQTPFVERLWGRVLIGPDCWDWAGRISQGYGYITIAGREHRAHRVMYERLIGAIPPDEEIDHECHNKACVRPGPGHCVPKSHAENCRPGEVGLNHGLKTHCLRGHAFDEANTYWKPSGGRQCKACQRQHNRR